jgi:hypothetical protein
MGGVGKAIGARGLGLRKLGQGLAVGGVCAIKHIPGRVRTSLSGHQDAELPPLDPLNP